MTVGVKIDFLLDNKYKHGKKKGQKSGKQGRCSCCWAFQDSGQVVMENTLEKLVTHGNCWPGAQFPCLVWDVSCLAKSGLLPSAHHSAFGRAELADSK